MRFEIGKCYQHIGTKEMMKIVGIAQTTGYGMTLVAEMAQYADFKAIGWDSDDYAENWMEISEERWLHEWGLSKKKVESSPLEGIPEIANIMCNNKGCPDENGCMIMENLVDQGNRSIYACPRCKNRIIVSKLEDVDECLEKKKIKKITKAPTQ